MKNFLILFFILACSNINAYSNCTANGGSVSGLTVICTNQIVYLTVTGVSGDTYEWQENHNHSGWVSSLPNHATLSFSTMLPGIYKFRVRAICYDPSKVSYSNELTITVNPPASAASSNPTYASLRHATARFTISGETYTGFLINHTSNDGRLLFLTTNQPQGCHSPNWNNVQFTWESDGTWVTSTGAAFLASENKMTLLQLNSPPNLPTLTYLGWDIIASPSNGSIACIFESGTSQSMNKSIVTANFNSVSTLNLNVLCNGNYSESSGSVDNKVSAWNVGGIVKNGRGAPIIRDNKKVVGVYVAGEEQNCVKGPSYFVRLQNSPNIVGHLRDNNETNAATVSMNYCKPSENLVGNFDESKTYNVSGHIISTQNIVNGNIVRYEAGTYIELNPGFSSGTNFIAEINPCVSNVTIIAAKTDDEPNEEKEIIFNNVQADNWLKIYPTILTSGNAITIESKEPINGLELQMFDMQGAHIRSFRLNGFGENTLASVALKDIPSGMYIIKAHDATRLFTQKILIR